MRSLTTTATLDQPSWNLIHQLVRQLEDGWRQGTPLNLDQFPLPLSGRSRERLLVELIKVDQDYRFQAGESRLLESYLGEWPELATQHDAVVELLVAECVTRAAHQALPTREDLAARFPDHADAIDLSALQAETRALSETSHDDSIKTSAGFEPLPHDFQASGKVFGRYEIRSVLGRGGMGSVYRAYDTQLGREVALKVPRFDVIADPVVRDRFVREARLAASVRHPNVCPIYDVGEINGTFYISMSLVEGESLAAMLSRGPLPAMQAAEIVRKLAQALTRVHEAGIIHRDIKPSNVIIDEHGEPLLMDFGLARPTQPTADQLITTAGSLLGTPIFMSPEQVAGDSAAVDARTDIYSLGVVLYQSLTGKLPFSGSLTDVLVQIAHADPLKPRGIQPDLDPRLETIVLKAIARRCEDRYQTPRELAVVLEEWLRRQERLLDIQAIALPASDTATAARWKRMRTWLVTVTLLLSVALTAVAIYVKTDKGTLEITSDDDEVSVVVEQAGKLVTVIDKKTGKQIQLPSGDYQLKLGEGADDLELIASEITLKRGKTTVATIRRISDRIAAAKTEDQARSRSVAVMNANRPADKENPFVILASKGKPRAEFKDLADAIAAIQKDDAIEIHGNGPYRVGQVTLSGRDLIVRAAVGFRPVILPASTVRPGEWWFTVLEGDVLIEGCEFRGGGGTGMLRGAGANWQVRNCRFLGPFADFLNFYGKKLRFENCLISTHGALGLVGGGSELELVNNLIWFETDGIGLHGPSGGQVVRLQHNTFVRSVAHHAPLVGFHGIMTPPERPLQVEAVGNIFHVVGRVVTQLPEYADWLDQLQWRGRDNLYLEPSLIVGTRDGQEIVKDLDGWNSKWGKEEGSRSVPSVRFVWDQVFTQPTEAAIQTLRQIVDGVREQNRNVTPDLGPDWDLVGPGEAFVRVLASQRPPLPEKLPTKVPPGGPFAVWRNARVDQAHPKFQDAIDAAADGDVIEIYTNEESLSAAFPTNKRLQLRAAPGYRPSVNGPLGNVSSVEGLCFRKPLLTMGTNRFVNCSFDEGLSIEFGADQVATKEPIEIINCWIADKFVFDPPPGRKMIVRNTVVGRLVLKGDGQHECPVELDRCVVWNPGPGIPKVGVLRPAFINMCAKKVHVSVSRTLVESGGMMFLDYDFGAGAGGSLRWRGTQNVYRIGRAWSNVGSGMMIPFDLDGWRRFQKSDELDSVEADPLIYDPLQWRLLPSSSDHLADQNGRDLGADVERQRQRPLSDNGARQQ